MSSFLYTWNPSLWNWEDRDHAIESVRSEGQYRFSWSCGITRKIVPGDTFFLIRLGVDPKGIIGFGDILSEPNEFPHWDNEKAWEGKKVLKTDILFRALSDTPILSLEDLKALNPGIQWTPQNSGIQIPADVSEAIAKKISRSDSDWNEEELRASVEAYLEMQKKSRCGERFSKVDIYRKLGTRFGRTAKAFEYRMQNISYVLSLLGRDWISGLKPARNVGTKIASIIEAQLSELEGRKTLPVTDFEIAVREEMKKKDIPKPSGCSKPRVITSEAGQFLRDPSVKAWVLLKAGGVCECCGKNAPFNGIDNEPFLEVHHLRHLADGGSDTVENAVALCPNCHREMHFGQKVGELKDRIYDTIERLVRE